MFHRHYLNVLQLSKDSRRREKSLFARWFLSQADACSEANIPTPAALINPDSCSTGTKRAPHPPPWRQAADFVTATGAHARERQPTKGPSLGDFLTIIRWWHWISNHSLLLKSKQRANSHCSEWKGSSSLQRGRGAGVTGTYKCTMKCRTVRRNAPPQILAHFTAKYWGVSCQHA